MKYARIKPCNLKSCKGMCCYDGVYLMDGEDDYIKSVVCKFENHFKGVVDNFIVDGEWKGVVRGKKTATKVCNNFSNDFPKHFEKTICVFAGRNGECALQNLAVNLGVHKWTFKPAACWIFPLKIVNGEITGPPKSKCDDPDKCGDYPGFVTYTSCGMDCNDGKKYSEALKEEVEFVKKLPYLPFWPNLNKGLDFIIKHNRRILNQYNL